MLAVPGALRKSGRWLRKGRVAAQRGGNRGNWLLCAHAIVGATTVETGGNQPVLQAGAAALKGQANSAGASKAQIGEGSCIGRALGMEGERRRDIKEVSLGQGVGSWVTWP